MKPKPIVGQTLYRLNIGNAAHRCEQKLVPVTVLSVGRKYFKCHTSEPGFTWIEHEFNLDDWRENSKVYGPSYKLYATEQEWLDEKEFQQILSELRNLFGAWGTPDLNLAQLRAIKAIAAPGQDITPPLS
jgi:hypothetical protein